MKDNPRKKSLPNYKCDLFFFCFPQRAERGSGRKKTLGHIDLLPVFSRRRLWEGSFEVAGKNSAERALLRSLLRKWPVEDARCSTLLPSTVAPVSGCDALTFSRTSFDCKTGITCFTEPLLAGSRSQIYRRQISGFEVTANPPNLP